MFVIKLLIIYFIYFILYVNEIKEKILAQKFYINLQSRFL